VSIPATQVKDTQPLNRPILLLELFLGEILEFERTLAEQVLHHLSHIPSPFFFIFQRGSGIFAWG
jgi:hypothetical protein